METKRAISIFEQVNQILRNKIFSGEFDPGSRLPSESALAAELGVSRATIRMVLGKLESEGIVSRKHGDGTYVNKHVLGVDVRPTRTMAFTHLIEESGRTPEVIGLGMDIRQPTREEIEKLELQKKEEVIQLVCLFLGDKQPTIYSINIFPFKMFLPKTEEYKLILPMHEFVKRYTSEQITYSVSDISAATAPINIADYLKVKLNEPILKSIDMFYNLKNKPLVLGINYYHNEAFRLRIAQPWS